jgi:putative endonuclease
MIPKKILGKYGEKHACKYLLGNSYKIIENNYRCRYGEIDIIAFKDNIFYFIEVKTRQSKEFGEPEESIDLPKLKKICLAAQHYISCKNLPECDYRFDAISVSVCNNKPALKHIKNIIQ